MCLSLTGRVRMMRWMKWTKWTKSTKRNQYTHLCLLMHYLPRHPFLLPRPARPPLWLHQLAFLWSTSLRPDSCMSIFVIILNFQAFSGDIHLKNAPLPAVKKQRAIVRLELLFFIFTIFVFWRGKSCHPRRRLLVMPSAKQPGDILLTLLRFL